MNTLSQRLGYEQKRLASIWAIALVGFSLMLTGLYGLGSNASVSNRVEQIGVLSSENGQMAMDVTTTHVNWVGAVSQTMSPVEAASIPLSGEPAISTTLPLIGGHLPEFLVVAGLVTALSAAYLDYLHKETK